jgi:hypothetical protein
MSFYDNILGVAVPIPGLDEAMFGDRTAGVPQPSGATFSAGQPAPDVAPEADRPDYRLPAAPQSPGADPDHDAVLDQALRAAGAPPHYLDSGHFVGAANLMAKEGLAPADAYDRVVLQSARDSGLVDDDDFHDAFGRGASDEVQRGGIPADVAPFAPGGANPQGGATAGDAQAGARVPGLGQAGGGGASGAWAADRGSERAPLVRIAADGEAGALYIRCAAPPAAAVLADEAPQLLAESRELAWRRRSSVRLAGAARAGSPHVPRTPRPAAPRPFLQKNRAEPSHAEPRHMIDILALPREAPPAATAFKRVATGKKRRAPRRRNADFPPPCVADDEDIDAYIGGVDEKPDQP